MNKIYSIDKFEHDRFVKQITNRYGKESISLIPENFIITKKLNEGAYGVVYRVKSLLDENDYALKIGKIGEREVEIQKAVALVATYTLPGNEFQNRLAPEIYAELSNNTSKKSILMREVEGNLEQLLKMYINDTYRIKQFILGVENLMEQLCKLKIAHIDLHAQNIAYVKSKENNDIYLYVIDFGMSNTDVCYKRVDRIQFIRGLYIFMEESKENDLKRVLELLVTILLKNYNTHYKINIRNKYSSIDDEYASVRGKV